MNINIRAHGHSNNLRLQEYYEDLLEEEFAKYSFLSRIDLNIKNEPSKNVRVGVELYPRGGKPIYTSFVDPSETIAYKKAIDRMKVRMEKYKNTIVQNHKVR